MATQQLGVAGLSVEARTFSDKTLQSRNTPDFIHEKFGQKRPIPANGGNRISIRQFTRPAAATTALTEGTPPSVTNPTVGETIISVAVYGAYMLGSDVLQKQAIDPQLTEWTAVFSEMMFDTRDQIVRDTIKAGTNVLYVGGGAVRSSVASGAALGWTDLRAARKQLKKNDAPPYEGGNYAAIIHPRVMSQLFADTTVVAALQSAGVRGNGNDLFKGSITTLLGISFNETSNASTFSGLGQSASFVEATLFCGRDAYTVTEYSSMASDVIFHEAGSSGINDPLNQAWSLGFKTALGTGIVDQNRLVRYESWSTGS